MPKQSVSKAASPLDISVTEVIDNYRTKHGRPEDRAKILHYAKSLTRSLHYESPRQAREVLGYLSLLAAWCLSTGIPLEPDPSLRHTTIERFVAKGMPHASDATRRNARVRLRRVGRRLVPQHHPVRSGVISKSKPSDPYSDNEIDQFLALAAAQPSDLRRDQLTLLVCLGVGAGLEPGDYRNLAGTDIRLHRGIVVADLSGRSPRTVPIDEPYGSIVYELASNVGSDYLIGVVPTYKSTTSYLTAKLQRANHDEIPNVRRLRATWLVRKLIHIDLRSLCYAAGIADSGLIFRLLSHVAVPTPEEVIRNVHEIR